jgi:hypothetical protein
MGFGIFGKIARAVSNIVQKGGEVVNKITTALKPVADVATTAISAFNPALGQAVRTGFDVVDNVSGMLKGGKIKPRKSILDGPPNVWRGRNTEFSNLGRPNAISNTGRTPRFRNQQFNNEEDE